MSKLREIRTEDWAALAALLADPEAVRHTEFEPFSEASARALVGWALVKAREEPRTAYVFGISPSPGGVLVGAATLTVRDAALGEADIGFILGREHWGRGHATAAADALLGLGFGRLGLHRITGECAPDNPASARVLEKVGMTREGCRQECYRQKGRWVDRLLYAILDHEWVERQR